VTIPEQVITGEVEALLDSLVRTQQTVKSGVLDDYTAKLLEYIRSSAPSFSAYFSICPSCQEGAFFEKVQEAFHKAVEKQVSGMVAGATPAGVVPFPIQQAWGEEPEMLEGETYEETHEVAEGEEPPF